jgi:hypothetical protein
VEAYAMKITEYSPINKTGSTAKKKGVSSASDGNFFGLLSANETESASSTPAASDVTAASMDALLALQEIPDNELAKRQAVEEGKGALETLERLRLDLLSGNISASILSKLSDISSLKKQFADDKDLNSIIQDIELRAAVELAKLQRATGE